MCISAGQNGAHLIKIAREEIGLQPRSKDILYPSIFRVPGKNSVIRVPHHNFNLELEFIRSNKRNANARLKLLAPTIRCVAKSSQNWSPE